MQVPRLGGESPRREGARLTLESTGFPEVRGQKGHQLSLSFGCLTLH